MGKFKIIVIPHPKPNDVVMVNVLGEGYRPMCKKDLYLMLSAVNNFSRRSRRVMPS